MSRKRHHVIPAILYAAVFALLCLSGPVKEAADTEGTIFGGVKVRLSSGSFPADTESLTTAIRAEDIAMLGHFSALREADFHGSDCMEDIAVWAEENPQIAVSFSVPMPDGSSVENAVTTLDLSGSRHEDVDGLCEVLGVLKDLEHVQLGSISPDGDGLHISDMGRLKQLLPEAQFEFNLSLSGMALTPDMEQLDLSSLTHEELEDAEAVLSCMGKVKSLTLGALSLEDALRLCAVCPGAVVDYAFPLYGSEVNLNAQALDFNHVEIKDEGAALSQVLPYMANCTSVDMDSTGVSNEALAALRDENPNVNIVWRIWFGENYSVRTDTERILASKPTVGGMISGKEGEVLKYCTKVKYLDIGHNEDMTDISFVASMPDLEVLIVAMSDITDLSPLANCTKLEYLELNSTEVSDLSPLANCAGLKHFNICNCPNITDISPIYDIPLERFWIGCDTPVPAEQVEEMRARHPEAKVNNTTTDPHGDSWRYYRYDPEEPKYYWVERYELLREQLGYNYQEYSFYWLDPKCGLSAPAEFAGQFGKEVYGLS